MIHFEFILASVKKHNSVVAVVYTGYVCVCLCEFVLLVCRMHRHSGTGVTDVCKPLWPLCGCCVLHSGRLTVLLTANPVTCFLWKGLLHTSSYSIFTVLCVSFCGLCICCFVNLFVSVLASLLLVMKP